MAPPPSSSNRRTSTRQVQRSTTRPSNYYARAFGPRGSVGNADTPPASAPPGFCPAISHFTAATDALPKELIKQFSLLKEVEGKAQEPETHIQSLFDKINDLPTISRAQSYRSAPPATDAGSLPSAANSVAGSLQYEAYQLHQEIFPPNFGTLPTEQQAVLRRRQTFYNLRGYIQSILPALDEKIIVLSNANRLLHKGLVRMESSYKHVGDEISDEARFGSLTHWAYADKEEKKKAAGPSERSRREAANADNLIRAAVQVEETAIAARSEARREAVLAKRSRQQQQVDSDFDERPPSKKAQTSNRARKGGEAGPAADNGRVHGLGISNGAVQPPKKRKTEKGPTTTSAPMERSMSGAVKAMNAAKLNGGSPRATPNVEAPKKKSRAPPTSVPAKKRNPAGAANSPSVAPSPAIPPLKDLLGPGGSQPARARRGSTPTSTMSNVDIARGRRSPSPHSHLARGGKTTAEIARETSDRARKEVRKGGSGVSTPREPDMAANEEDNVPQGAVKPLPAGATSSKPGSPSLGGVAMGRSRSTRNNNKSADNSNTSSESNLPLAAAKSSQKKKAAESAAAAAAPSKPPGTPKYSAFTGHLWEPGDDADNVPSDDDEMSSVHEPGSSDYDVEDMMRYCICDGPGFGNMIGCDYIGCYKQWFHWDCVGITKEPSSKTKWYCEECKERMKKSRPASRA